MALRTFSKAARDAMSEIVIAGRQRADETEHQFVHRVYEYDPATGDLKRRIRCGGASAPGTAMGNMSAKGYLRIAYKGRQIQLHRLIWFYQTGEWPVEQVDHINGITNDNRWSNLRAASNSENKMNNAVRKDSGTGIKGVTIDKRTGRFRAHITRDGRRAWLGYFATLSDAHAARVAASSLLHGDFAKETTQWRSAVMAGSTKPTASAARGSR